MNRKQLVYSRNRMKFMEKLDQILGIPNPKEMKLSVPILRNLCDNSFTMMICNAKGVISRLKPIIFTVKLEDTDSDEIYKVLECPYNDLMAFQDK